MEKPTLRKLTIQIARERLNELKRAAIDEDTTVRALVLEGIELRLRAKQKGRKP